MGAIDQRPRVLNTNHQLDTRLANGVLRVLRDVYGCQVESVDCANGVRTISIASNAGAQALEKDSTGVIRRRLPNGTVVTVVYGGCRVMWVERQRQEFAA